MLKKYLLISVAILILFFTFHFFYYNNKICDLSDEIYELKAVEVIDLFDSEVEKKFGKTFAMTYLISQDKNLIDALVKKDRTLIDFTNTIKEVERYGEYKNLWIQVIDKEGYSFYRSWTSKVGDHAASARIDVVEMLKDPKPMRGISTGRFDMTFKTMIPLYNNNEFIGMIEMISKFNSIAHELEKHQVNPLMVLHEDYTKRFIKPFTGLFIDNNYIANLNASKKLMKKAQEYGIKKLMYLEKPILLEEYLVFKTEIKDIHGGEMGFFIFFFEEKYLDKSTVYNFQTEYFSKIIVALVLLILILLYTFYKKYSDKLNREVIKKTSEIEKQKKRLSSLLETYDESVIFSKSDLSGNIIYASKAFCEISGYTKEELIGKPHNIIRHPDMNKSAFEDLWKTIQAGKVWSGEVKNLRKDGSYYWVDATIEPIFDESKNEIVGYVSTRNDITARKEFEEQQIVMQNQSKLAAMGEMIGNIAHQWRQPLSVITTIASGIQLKKDMGMLKDEDIDEGMQKTFESANYLSETIETFRNFLQENKEYKEICIGTILDRVSHILKATLINNNIEVINSVSSDDKVCINLISGELEQVLINIINNSKDAFLENSIEEPKIMIDLAKEEDFVVLTLEDNAGGIPAEVLPKIFEPYFTTKDKSIGTGLGLYMSYKIIKESLGGELSAKNINKGARFTIKLPL